jgi:hypothetical protein
VPRSRTGPGRALSMLVGWTVHREQEALRLWGLVYHRAFFVSHFGGQVRLNRLQ